MTTTRPIWLHPAALGSIVLAPLALLVSSAALPSLRGTNGSELPVARAHQAAYYVFVSGGIVGSILLVVACLAIAMRVYPTHPRLGSWAAALTVVGNGLALVDWGTELVKWQMAAGSLDVHAMDSLADQLDTTAGVIVPLQVAGLTTLAGFVVLGLGIARSHLAPTWVAVALPLGVLLNLVGFASGTVAVLDVSGAVLVVAMAALALRGRRHATVVSSQRVSTT